MDNPGGLPKNKSHMILNFNISVIFFKIGTDQEPAKAWVHGLTGQIRDSMGPIARLKINNNIIVKLIIES